MRVLSAHRGTVGLVVAGVLVAVGAGLVACGAQSGGHIPVPPAAHTFDVSTASASPVQISPLDAGSAEPSGAASSATSSATSSAAPTTATGNRPSSASHKPPPPKTGNRLVIPSLGVNATLLDESIVDNSLSIPDDVDNVGHYRGGGALVGTAGTVLLAGHVNERGQGDGALYQLSRIAANAVVQTITAAGAVSSWHVTSVQEVNKAALPQDIFTADGPRRLVVVTCGGALLPIPGQPGTFSYQDNVIVTASPS